MTNFNDNLLEIVMLEWYPFNTAALASLDMDDFSHDVR